MTENETTKALCGYEVADADGIAGPCDMPTTGWRWYEHCGHEPVLERACAEHSDEGGRRIHEAESQVTAREAAAWAQGYRDGESATLGSISAGARLVVDNPYLGGQ